MEKKIVVDVSGYLYANLITDETKEEVNRKLNSGEYLLNLFKREIVNHDYETVATLSNIENYLEYRF